MKKLRGNRNKDYNRGSYKVKIKHIGKIYPSVSAVQYHYSKNYLKYHDYKYRENAEQLKSQAITTIRKTKPYKDEKCLNISIEPMNTSINVSFKVRCYSGKNHSDNHNTDNLPKYISDNFSSGDVVRAKLIDTNGYSILLTDIKHAENQHAVESIKRV